MKKLSITCLVPFALVLSATQAKPADPLQLVQTIPLPGVEGRIDHFAVDLDGARLFAAALGNNTVEVVDLEAGQDIASIGGFSEPQGVAFVLGSDKLFVANGGDGTVDSFDGTTFDLLNVTPFANDADNLRYDASADQLYVGYGGGALGILNATSEELIGDIRLAGHPESFQLEKFGPRVFVNVPTAQRIQVVDRDQGVVVDNWQVPVRDNFPMALDEGNQRLFVAARSPAQLLVYDTSSGDLVAQLDCVGDADDVFYDAVTGRIYVSGGAGFISVFQQHGADQYELIANIPTAAGARTSLFVPEFNRLYLAVPHQGAQAAQIWVYEVQP
jgi:DNA-binding beta-propeller fold protein YncE